MTPETAKDLIAELDLLLDRERSALIGGNLDQIADLMEQKEALIERLRKIGATESKELDHVHGKVVRNHALLASAMEGIRAVSDRMAELRRVRQGLETYDSRSRKTRIQATGQSTVEKRALSGFELSENAGQFA